MFEYKIVDKLNATNGRGSTHTLIENATLHFQITKEDGFSAYAECRAEVFLKRPIRWSRDKDAFESEMLDCLSKSEGGRGLGWQIKSVVSSSDSETEVDVIFTNYLDKDLPEDRVWHFRGIDGDVLIDEAIMTPADDRVLAAVYLKRELQNCEDKDLSIVEAEIADHLARNLMTNDRSWSLNMKKTADERLDLVYLAYEAGPRV